MKHLQLYDPPLCCSTGVCGPDIDPTLPRVAGFLAELGTRGIKVERFNLAQQPIAFVQNAAVRRLLEQHGVAALPAVFVDGELALQGAYPDPDQCAGWLARAGARAGS